MSDPTVSDVPTQPLSLPAHPERTGGRAVGVLLVHGFTGSPASMKPWGRHLAEQGYAVEVPVLPGHGTRWQDLNQVSWTDWYAQAERSFDALRTTCEAVVVCGLSMGGSVALRLAEERGDQVSGVVLVNPFVSSNRKELKAIPLLKHVVPGLKGVVNDIKKPGQDEVGYPKLPLKGLAQVMEMWKVVVPDLGRVTQPLLYFRSGDRPRHRRVVVAHRARQGPLHRRRGADPRQQLPRGDARPRRPAHLRGVRGFRCAGDRLTLVG